MSMPTSEPVSILANDNEHGYNTCGCATPHKSVLEFVDCVLAKVTAMPAPGESSFPNTQAVGCAQGYVEILEPQWRMTKPEALAHAAWIVALVGDEDTFFEILGSIQHDPGAHNRA